MQTNQNKEQITIHVSGPKQSGKGHVMALVTKKLRELGLTVVLQGEGTHNAPKMEKEHAAVIERLKDTDILILEQQT